MTEDGMEATFVTELKTADGTAAEPVPEPRGRLLVSTVELAVRTVAGCDYAGVLIRTPDRQIISAAATDDVVLRCDDAQRDLGDGPSIDTGWDGAPRVIQSDDDNWPKFGEKLAAAGVASMLITRIENSRHTVASLNLYSERPGAFDDAATAAAEAFAAHAALALASDQLEQHLRIAVESRQAIGQAVGILMERHKLDADAAFDLLVRASQKGSVKLRDIAARVVEAGPDSLR